MISFLLCILQAYAVSHVKLIEGVVFGWYMPDDNSLAFYVYFPQIFLDKPDIGWFGIGFKQLESYVSMDGADLVTINLKTDEIQSRTSLGNAYPKIDDESGFDDSKSYPIDKYKVYTWIRPCETGIEGDIDLYGEEVYTIMFAYGALDENGLIAKHSRAD